MTQVNASESLNVVPDKSSGEASWRHVVERTLALVDELWNLPRLINPDWRSAYSSSPLQYHPDFTPQYEATTQRLIDDFSIDQLQQAFTGVICQPDEVKTLVKANSAPPEGAAGQIKTAWVPACSDAVQYVASTFIIAHPTEAAATAIAVRLHKVMSDSSEPCSWDWLYHRNEHRRDAAGYLFLLARLASLPPAMEAIRAVLRGEWDDSRAKESEVSNCSNQLTHRDYQLLERLFQASALTYELFREVVLQKPGLIAYGCASDAQVDPNTPSLGATLHRFRVRFLREQAAEFTPQQAPAFTHHISLRGASFLLCACKQVEELKVKKLTPKIYKDNLETALGQMAHIAALEPEDDAEQIVAQLRKFERATLETVLPAAGAGKELILRALDKEKLLTLLRYIETTGQYEPDYQYHQGDIPNNSDPRNGTLDIAQVCAALKEAGGEEVKKLLKGLRQSQIGLNSTLLLIEAVAGWNRDDVLKKFEKRNQPAVKAFGALPLQNSKETTSPSEGDEVLERYLRLRQFARESQQFGSERRQNEAAAVEAALSNLAQVAGYADLTRLEWAMESRLAGADYHAQCGDYEATIEWVEGEPQLKITRGGKTLKTPPAALKNDAGFGRLKEAVSQLKKQRARFRTTLESMMAQGQTLSPEDLKSLVKLPAARVMLDKLIFLPAQGAPRFGMLSEDFLSLRAEDDEKFPIQGDLKLAHPLDLFSAGKLALWQRAIVKRKIVQPFKQAFRELYILTPAERETRVFSNRFAGHVVSSKVAARLMGARGWRLDPDGEYSNPEKLLRDFGLRAVFVFANLGHYFSEIEEVVSDQIYFMPPDAPRYWNQEQAEHRVPLEQVPPLAFSEIMRDADLFVSVAQRDGNGTLSNEAYERRADVVRTIVEDLELPGVTLEGHFAYVQGKLARYRVHLSSAVIHIEPGNYLCIVPARAGTSRERLFLPFADEDAKLSEVISKILMLSHDDQIKDQSILNQIKARRDHLSALLE